MNLPVVETLVWRMDSNRLCIYFLGCGKSRQNVLVVFVNSYFGMARGFSPLAVCMSDPLPVGEHLVQHQRVYLRGGRLSSLRSMQLKPRIEFRGGTVVDFVTVKASAFNSFLYPKELGC
jgi:hypothetical protein